jgi:hypothetical protein
MLSPCVNFFGLTPSSNYSLNAQVPTTKLKTKITSEL